MKIVLTVALVIVAAAATPVPAAESAAADHAAIEACARDYLEGWYDGDAARMERALHPDLAKRTVRQLTDGGGEVLSTLSCSNMIAYTKAGYGTKSKRPDMPIEVIILDVGTATASVKTITPDFVDYLHLARIDGRWWIVNVLWEPPAGQ